MQRTRTQPTILVVEDYADTRHMLELLLEGLDYAVVTAATGKEALLIAANSDVDLILTDYGLPDMTGIEVVRNVRRLRNHAASVPIVMLTAFDGYQYRDVAQQAGCDAFFVKPPDFDFLERTLDRLLHETRVETRFERQIDGIK